MPSVQPRKHSAQVGRRKQTSWCLLALFFMGLLPSVAFAELSVSMTADRAQVAVGQSLVLQVEVATDSLQGPEVTLPNLDEFDVLKQSMQKPMRFSFGLGGQQVRSSTIYQFVLQPRHQGRITIGAATAKQGNQQAKSKELVIVVGNGQEPAAPAHSAPSEPAQPAQPAVQAEVVDHGSYVDAQQVDPQAFIRTVVDKSHPYEGEQVTVTFYLYSRRRLRVPPTIDQEPSTEGLWTQDLLDGQTLEQVRPQQIGRVRYNVYVLRRFAAFPLRAGQVNIGSMALTIEQPRSLFDMFEPGNAPASSFSRQSIAVPLDVTPLPEESRPAGEVAVGKFSVDAKLDRNQTATGDAVTLTATLAGRGYIQAAKLAMPPVDGLEILAPQVHDLTDIQDDHVGGSKVFEWLVVPQKPGTYVLPPLSLHTFDPETGKYAEVQGPQLTLTAAGQAVQTAQATQEPRKDDLVVMDHGNEKPLKLAPIRTHSALLRNQAHVHEQGWFQLALAIPPFLLITILGVDLARRRARGRVPSHYEVRLQQSHEHLSQAQSLAIAGDSQRFFAEVARALDDTLDCALSEPVGSFTRPQLRKRLMDAGMEDALLTELLTLLERCDAARFAPGQASAAHLQESLDAAKRLQGKVLAWKPPVSGAQS